MVGSDIYLGFVTRKRSETRSVPEVEARPTYRYEDALAEYLQGDYRGARERLSKILDSDSEDTEALLFMATILRKEGSLDGAAGYLDRAGRSPRGEKWAEEIAEERLWMIADVTEKEDSPRDEIQERMEAA
jgi:predicted Zn-dependent protease